MAIEDKTQFMESIKVKMSDVLTVSNMNNLMTIMCEELNNYDLSSIMSYESQDDDLLETFLNALNAEGRSKKTIKRYSYVIKRMLQKICVPTYRINVSNIRKYINDEKNRGISDRTLENERQIFNRYFGWLYRESLIRINPMSNIGGIKYRKKVKDVFSDIDLELIKKACNTTRNLAIVTFLMATGCRIGEVVALNKDSVDFQNLTVRVLGKGDKERITYIDEVSAMFLKKYLDERKDSDECLFISRTNQRISIRAIQKMLVSVEKRANVTHVHPHKFRRTLATTLYRRGMPIEKIKEILGHENINTTMQYIVLDQSDIEHDYRKFY